MRLLKYKKSFLLSYGSRQYEDIEDKDANQHNTLISRISEI